MRHQSCVICSQLRDFERGLQVFGREEQDTFLPEIAARLKKVKEVKPGGLRYTNLVQCPQCGAYYLFKSDYEYLACGSEDEQTLQRLSDDEAAAYEKAEAG